MIYDEIHSDLSKTIWIFIKIDETVFLDGMLACRRETRRHKWRVINEESWSRSRNRDYRIKEEPDAPLEAQVEAIEYFKSKITVKKWNYQ